MRESDYTSFFDALDKSKKTVVLTGAGISTLSGIKDFRSSNGLYSQEFGHMRVEDILDIDFFLKHPSVFYSWAKDAWYNMHDYKPNVVHRVLRIMEEKGLLSEGIFTQNIDGLHTREGSKNVFELHGTIERSICTKCGESFSFQWTKELVDRDVIPMCPHCRGLIKPHIVFYGEGSTGQYDAKYSRLFKNSWIQSRQESISSGQIIVAESVSIVYEYCSNYTFAK